MTSLISLIEKLKNERMLTSDEFQILLDGLMEDSEAASYLQKEANSVARRHFGNKVYIRGLIEFTNFCRNDCFYCGIRKSNLNAVRYHLSKDSILACCHAGYYLGFRTFVLQGGEDMSYTDNAMAEIISEIRKKFPDFFVLQWQSFPQRSPSRRIRCPFHEEFRIKHLFRMQDPAKAAHPDYISAWFL